MTGAWGSAVPGRRLAVLVVGFRAAERSELYTRGDSIGWLLASLTVAQVHVTGCHVGATITVKVVTQ